MSGRLIILPKKNYCPWNPQNLERVLRDERLEKERIERQTQQEEKRIKEEKIRNKKFQKNAAVGQKEVDAECSEGSKGSNSEQQQQHVNLFEKEELESQRDTTVQSTTSTRDDTANAGIMPIYLTDRISQECKKQEVPFYIKKDRLSSRKDEQLKRNMDPMREFHFNDTIGTDDVSTKQGKDQKRIKKHRKRDGREKERKSSRIKTHKRREKKSPEVTKKRKSTSKGSSPTSKFQEMVKRQRSRSDVELEREALVRTK